MPKNEIKKIISVIHMMVGTIVLFGFLAEIYAALPKS